MIACDLGKNMIYCPSYTCSLELCVCTLEELFFRNDGDDKDCIKYFNNDFLSDAGDAVPTKKAKVGCQIDGVTVRWEWEGDKSTWTQYSDDKNENITDAFSAKQPSV